MTENQPFSIIGITMTTDGKERFVKLVNHLGLYLSDDDRAILDKYETMTDWERPQIMAYLNDECYINKRGYLLAIVDDCVYCCHEACYRDEKFYCNGCIPTETFTDEGLMTHLGKIINDYKKHQVKKKIAELNDMFD